MIFVKVAKLGQAVRDVSLEDNSSVETAIRAAGMTSDGYSVKVNGRNPCGALQNNDVVSLVPAIKGGRS